MARKYTRRRSRSRSRSGRRNSYRGSYKRLPTRRGDLTKFMHPYSQGKRRTINLRVDYFRKTKNGGVQAVAVDNHGRKHFKFVKGPLGP